MIPLSVRMKGWMRYRDEQVADFGAGPLIAICGENGAGKSSIFDAITFALYGVHRLGKQHAGELISQDEDRLSVEFEFEADGSRYLVRRSRGRKESERDQSLWVWDGQSSDWAQVPGTEKEDALRRSLDHIVRLSPEAFTSSFLLQQGEATQFLDADPKPRFDIISSLIGLHEYEALEKRAREAAKVEKILLDNATAKIAEIGDLDEDAIARLRTDVDAAATRETEAAELLAAAKAMLADAQRFAALTAEVAELRTRIAAAETLLAERGKIESDAALFETLSSAIDAVDRIRAALADASRAAAAAADAEKRASAIDVDALGAAAKAATAAVKSATSAQQAAENAHAALTQDERMAYEFAQAAAALMAARDAVATLDARLKEIDASAKQLAASGAKFESDLTAAKKQLESAEAAVESARTEAAQASARVKQLKSDLDERKRAAKDATCSRCGQPIDKKAAKQQIEEMSAQLGAESEAATRAVAAEKSAMAARTAAKKQLDDAAAALATHASQASRIDGERAAAIAEGERARASLAESEMRIGDRAKDVAAAEKAHAAAKAKLDAAERALTAARRGYDAARTADDASRAVLDAGRQQRAAAESAAREQAAVAAGHRRQAEAFADQLGAYEEQALTDPNGLLDVFTSGQSQLEGAIERKGALEHANTDHKAASEVLARCQRDIDAIPAAHHVDGEAAREAAGAAAAEAESVRALHRESQRRLVTAEAHVEQIAQLRADVARAKVRYARLKKLTTLLGKKGLQGALVSGALTTITNHANAFLQRLTGGTLQLTLQRGEGDALDLQALDSTCMRDARSVKALSGSQKFRCAVAIASGIGQYAGAGGMRSIVIDEGFGSLDVAGQQLMVEELKQLATHMDKVIVVSHLEAFTDPMNFPDRIVVEQDGAGSRIRVVTG